MDARLAGKVIIVAGAGGIGGELARRYAHEGAIVVVGDRDEASAGSVVDEITATGGTALATSLDGADDDSIRALVDLAVSRFGGLDGFHANFAFFEGGNAGYDVLDLPLEAYDESMRVNTRGFLLCTRHAVPVLMARGGGSIVYTSSGAAFIGEQVRVAYAMSKAATHALMRHVAQRFGPQGIRANAIAPGVIVHPKLEAMMPADVVQGFRDMTALKTRLGAPADIAATAALLMADEGAFITGQVISVDGGASMRQ